MFKLQEQLIDFAKRISHNEPVCDVINKIGLGFICDKQLPFGVEKINIIANRIQQDKLNKIYLNELETMYSLCTNFEPLIFKGIAYAYSLYKVPNVRICNDLDLFVRTQDIDKFEKVLEIMQYEKINCDDNKYLFYIGDLYSNYGLIKGNYIDRYIRNHQEYTKTINGLKINVELHSYILSPMRYPLIQYDNIYNKREMIKIVDKTIYTLSFIDDFVCYVCHFCKHIICAVARPNDKKNHIDMKSIIDIKLMIEKNFFVWDNVIERAEEWGALSSLYLTLRLINYVFPKTVDENILINIKNMTINIQEKHSHESLIRGISFLKIEDIFNFNLKDFFKEETIDETAACYSVFSNKQMSNKIKLDNKLAIIPYWDRNYFKIIFEYKELIFENGILSITIGSNISYLYAQTFFISINKNSYKLACSYTDEKFDSLNNVIVNIGNEYITIDIPWKNLNISPKYKDILPFNFKIIVLDESDHIISKYSLTEQNYYNDYGTCSILLNN